MTISPGYLRCLFSRENLNSTFSASYIKMTIAFDVLYRFQENNIFSYSTDNEVRMLIQTQNDQAQNGSFVTMEAVTF